MKQQVRKRESEEIPGGNSRIGGKYNYRIRVFNN